MSHKMCIYDIRINVFILDTMPRINFHLSVLQQSIITKVQIRICKQLKTSADIVWFFLLKTKRKTKTLVRSIGIVSKKYISYRIPYADKITPEPILNNNAGRDTKADSIRNSYNSQFKVGIYGWRKKCLYILVMALMFMMIINLALTLWVLKVLDFNSVRLDLLCYLRFIMTIL